MKIGLHQCFRFEVTGIINSFVFLIVDAVARRLPGKLMFFMLFVYIYMNNVHVPVFPLLFFFTRLMAFNGGSAILFCGFETQC